MPILSSVLFAVGVMAAGVSAPQLSTLTSVLTVSVAENTRLDVLSSSDVVRVAGFEVNRAEMGCEGEDSCLAELAGALDANWVIFGDLGELGSKLVLTLSLFDSERAVSAGRVIVQADSVEELSGQMEAKARELSKKIVERSPQDDIPIKVVVLNLISPNVSPQESGAAPDNGSPAAKTAPSASAADAGALALALYGTGGAIMVAGVAGAVTGGIFGALAFNQKNTANDTGTSLTNAKAAVATARDQAKIADVLFVVGGTLAVIGGTVAAIGLLVGGAEE